MRWLRIIPLCKVNDVGPLKHHSATRKAFSFVQIFPVFLPHVLPLALLELPVHLPSYSVSGRSRPVGCRASVRSPARVSGEEAVQSFGRVFGNLFREKMAGSERVTLNIVAPRLPKRAWTTGRRIPRIQGPASAPEGQKRAGDASPLHAVRNIMLAVERRSRSIFFAGSAARTRTSAQRCWSRPSGSQQCRSGPSFENVQSLPQQALDVHGEYNYRLGGRPHALRGRFSLTDRLRVSRPSGPCVALGRGH